MSDSIAVLQDALAELDSARARIVAAIQGLGGQASGNVVSMPQRVEPADDADLDSQYGDPQVRTMPKDWTGADFRGANFSQTSPEFLDKLAGLLQWQAGKSDEKNEMANNGKPRSGYLRRDAARALGWARRLRAKAKPRPAPAPRRHMDEEEGADDMPF